MGEALAVDTLNNPLNTYNKIDLAEAFKLRFKHHLSFKAISERFGCNPSAVYQALAPFSKLINNSVDSNIYETNKAGILNSVQFEIVKQMVNKGKLKSASLNNLAYAASQVDNMIRLEKGQPTSITETLDADLSGLLDRIAPLKSAGSGSTIDVTPAADTNIDVEAAVNQAIGLPAPPADHSTTGNLEPTNSPVEPVKPRKSRKPRTQTVSKSIVKCRKQDACNITGDLDSKIDATKQGTSAAAATDTITTTAKEWYE